MTFKIYKTLH